MSWFAAHELYTALNHVRANAEAIVAGAHGRLPMGALEAAGAIVAAARELEETLRVVEEIDALERAPARPHERTSLADLARLAGLESEAPHAPEWRRPLALACARQTARGLAILARDILGGTRLRPIGDAHRIGLVLAAPPTGARLAGGALGTRLALARALLRRNGARIRSGSAGALVLWRQDPAGTAGCAREHSGLTLLSRVCA